ncbi:MAG: hypothetical protein GY868_05545 [Deltaproteobacteria bacterium]|nr:hypothetical protein [Deltaproteobacteria bacterium]
MKTITYRIIVPAILFITLSLCIYGPAAAAPKGIKPGLVAKTLRTLNLETQPVRLLHNLQPVKALSFRGSQGTAVTLGFPGGSIKHGAAFPLVIDDIELEASFTQQDGLRITGDDQLFVSQGIFDVLECLMFALDDMAESVVICDMNSSCIIGSLIVFFIELSVCPINIL